MKVWFKNMVLAYSGKCDGLVYYYNEKLGRMKSRKYVIPRRTEQNARFTSISVNLKALNISEDYKNDLRDYTLRYSTLNQYKTRPCLNWYSVFTLLMWNMSRALGIDLATLTREQIESEELPCRSVKDAVEAGLLPPVLNYQRLDRLI